MNFRFWSPLAALALTVAVVGCRDGSTDKPSPQTNAPAAAGKSDKASARANLEKLSPEDKKLAEEQVFCAVESENPLGSMGVPYKVTVKGQPVFLCCDGCEARALAHADRTLARVKQLKERATGSPEK